MIMGNGTASCCGIIGEQGSRKKFNARYSTVHGLPLFPGVLVPCSFLSNYEESGFCNCTRWPVARLIRGPAKSGKENHYGQLMVLVQIFNLVHAALQGRVKSSCSKRTEVHANRAVMEISFDS